MSYTPETLGCPLPPADLEGRPLSRITLDLALTPLWRIHRAHLGPIHGNRRADGATPYRFDAAGGEFGVLYASPSFAACMAEAVIRERFHRQRQPLLLDESELTTRCVSRLVAPDGRPLVLADLTAPPDRARHGWTSAHRDRLSWAQPMEFGPACGVSAD